MVSETPRAPRSTPSSPASPPAGDLPADGAVGDVELLGRGEKLPVRAAASKARSVSSGTIAS